MAIQAEEALEADAVSYYARIMCQLSLPISQVSCAEYTRESGPYHLSISTPKAVGIPYGRYPRGILNWLVTEIVKKHGSDDGSRTVVLGKDLSEFMEKVSGSSAQSGGELGNIRRFKRQLTSLLMSRIIYWTNDEERTAYKSMEVSSSGLLFWNPGRPNQRGLLQSSIQMGQAFWDDCIRNKVPVDLRVIRGLWDYGCMALDAYAWLTYRAYTRLAIGRTDSLKISWSALKFQFGQQYARERKFREVFSQALLRVRQLYSGFTVDEWEGKGLAFRFNRPSILVLPGQEVGRVPSEATKLPGIILHLKRPQKSADPSA